MDRKLVSLKVTPAPRGVIRRPVVVQIAVESSVVRLIAVIAGDHALCRIRPVSALIIQIPWEEIVCFVGHVGVNLSGLHVNKIHFSGGRDKTY